MRIGIVGAGIAGLACAEELIRLGHQVRLLDKGRGPGGRMSTRRIQTAVGEAAFDHGAQYFTARDADFRRQVETWAAEGVVAPWPAAGPDAFVGVPGMNAPVRWLAARHAAQWATQIARVVEADGGWRLEIDQGEAITVEALVMATPAEQSAALLAAVAPALAAQAQAAVSAPCWTLMLAFSEALPVAQDCWRGDGAVGWAARNSSKPGRTGPETWVVQGGPEWSRAHLEDDPASVAAALKAAFAAMVAVPLPPIAGESCHRWRYAKSGADGAGALFDADRRLGLCGDWLIGPRVEAAWLSGRTLAGRIGAA